MAEEKVGFGFEFGIKGDKEVKRTLEDIFRLMGNSTNAAQALTGILGKAGGLFELGALAAPVAVVGTAMAAFGYASERAGENLRKARFELSRLTQTPAAGLTDSGLDANQSALVDQFSRLGLEAGNRFNESLLTKLKNFGNGAKAVDWDFFASIQNLFGGNVKSYEQSSPEAKRAMDRLREDQRVAVQREAVNEKTQQSMAAIQRQAQGDIAEVFNREYLSRIIEPTRNPKTGKFTSPGSFTSGVLPESYAGQQRLMDIRQQTADAQKMALNPQLDMEETRLDKLKDFLANPPSFIQGTNERDVATRNKEIASQEQKVNDLLARQNDYRQQGLEIDLQRRDLVRNFISSQSYGSYRSVGGGGRTPYDPMPDGSPSLATRLGLGGLNGRVPGHLMGPPDPSAMFRAGAGHLQNEGVHVLKDINKRIGKIGIPTLSQ